VAEFLPDLRLNCHGGGVCAVFFGHSWRCPRRFRAHRCGGSCARVAARERLSVIDPELGSEFRHLHNSALEPDQVIV